MELNNVVLGFTGTRQELDEEAIFWIQTWVRAIRPREVHHGDCVGADTVFHNTLVKEVPDCFIVSHPGDTGPYRAHNLGDSYCAIKPPLMRNKDIVRAADLMLACPEPGPERVRSGTWSTVRFARTQGCPIVVRGEQGWKAMKNAARVGELLERIQKVSVDKSKH